ncbi:MAG: YIP1 family protein [Pirellulales bacterium]
MSIEFRCNQCGKLLRTADDTAGQPAQCPSCSAIQPIPFGAAIPDDGLYGLAEPPPSMGSPFARPAQPGPTPFNYGNPYASPMSPATARYDEYFEDGPRTGPPWERDAPSVRSFIATAREALGSTSPFFFEMRREGGFGLPLAYSFLGGMIGALAQAFHPIVLVALLQTLLPNNFRPADPAEAAWGPLITLAAAPLVVIIYPFILAAILHVMLAVLGSTHFPYETTYRVTAYSTGTAALLSLVPFCGRLIELVTAIVLLSIGLAQAHEASGGKAAAAVLLPFVVCGGLAVAVFVVAGLAAGM